jgi:hypothetical protein
MLAIKWGGVDPNHTTAKKLIFIFPFIWSLVGRSPFSKGGRWWPYYYRGRGGGGEGRDRFYLSLDHLSTIMGALSLGIFGLYIFPIF